MNALKQLMIIVFAGVIFVVVLADGPVHTLQTVLGQLAELMISLIAAAREYPMVLLAGGVMCVILLSGLTFASRAAEDPGRLEGAFGKSLFTGGLTLMAAKVFALPDAPSGIAIQIFHFYGALSLVFLVFHLMALRGFVSEWLRLRVLAKESARVTAAEAMAAPSVAQPFVKSLCLLAGAVLLLLLIWGFVPASAFLPMGLAQPETDAVKNQISAADDASVGNDKDAAIEETGPTGEIVRSLAVSQAFASEASASADGGSLPDGLRFFWEGDGGWEPAFVRQDVNGRFWLAGRIVEAETVRHAYAIDGPGVSPDRSGGQGDVLFFHRDVLHELDRHFSVRQTGAVPRVNVRPRGGQSVVLSIFTDHAGESLPESLQVTLR